MRQIEALGPEQPISLFDIDGTLTTGDSSFTIFTFAKYLANQGLMDQEGWGAMQVDFDKYKNSESSKEDYKEFALNLVSHYAQGLKGRKLVDITTKAVDFLNDAIAGRIDGYQISNFSSGLVDIMNRHTITIAASGSPEESLTPLIQHLGISHLEATQLEVVDGVFTGNVIVNMAIDSSKGDIVEQLEKQGYDKEKSFAFGDSPHDKPLLGAVNELNAFGVGHNLELESMAKDNSWQVLKKPEEVIPAVRARVIEVFGGDA